MSPLIGPDALVDDLKRLGLRVEGPVEVNKLKFVVVRQVGVEHGSFAGRSIDVAVQPPADYPAVPPGGLYVSPQIAPVGQHAVHDRQGETGNLLGQDWQYWSRPFPPKLQWNRDHAPALLLMHWRTVLANYGSNHL